ncbi:MAG: glycerophosphodiester phosphodiesterase family protein [Methylovirgula sp.]
MTWQPNAPDWLIARPIAHRGLHDSARGIIENSLAAARRAIAKNYAIECDVQLSKDGEAIVFHDDSLPRLLGIPGEIGALTTQDLARCAYKGSSERVATLPDFFAEIAGRAPLIVELKSRFDGDARLAARVAQLAENYAGPLALKSFDPQTLHALREGVTERPLGLVAQAHYAAEDWPKLSASTRQGLEALTDFPRARPDFLSWHVGDLPHATPMLCRVLGMKIMTWTVRNAAEQALTAQWADQIIFEGFEP